MKKYLQITVVLSLFFAVVLIKSLRGSDDGKRVIEKQSSIIPTSSPQATVPPPTLAPQGSTSLPSAPASLPTATPIPQQARGQYKDGSYTGSVEDAYYGLVQVKAIITGGRLSDVQILQHPSDNGTSININSQAMPILRDEAIQAQSANVDIVSGASDSSPAFSRSLASALSQAK